MSECRKCGEDAMECICKKRINTYESLAPHLPNESYLYSKFLDLIEEEIDKREIKSDELFCVLYRLLYVIGVDNGIDEDVFERFVDDIENDARMNEWLRNL